MNRNTFLLTLFVLFLISCQSVPVRTRPVNDDSPGEEAELSVMGEWSQVYPGIEQIQIHRENLPLMIYAFRIDLHHPDREVIVTDLEAIDGFQGTSKVLSSFAKEEDTLVAINATTFAPYRDSEGMGVNLTTLSIHQGMIQAPQRDPMAALLVMNDGRVELHWPPFDYPNIRYAAGCGPLYLLNGTNRGQADSRHPRSAVGLSQDGRFLIMMVIDGRKEDYSIGVSMKDAADWMKELGAWNALNLDGGGSSTLILKDPQSGEQILVNQPSGPPARGQERPVANHIGIR